MLMEKKLYLCSRNIYMMMKQVKISFLAAVLFLCGLCVLTSCSSNEDNTSINPLSGQIAGRWVG